MRLHDDELAIDIDLVRELVARQFPAYANETLASLAATGSTNLQFRLGSELLVRMPRQPGGGATIRKEQRWTSVIGASLPVAVPEIVAVGEPDLGYSEHWALVRWLDGTLPESCNTTDDSAASCTGMARDLAGVVAALRGITVPDTARKDPQFRNYRGGKLTAFDEAVRASIDQWRTLPFVDLDLDLALHLWERSLALPGADQINAVSWYHGDLVAENLLVAGDRLTGVLDFGGLAIGDPTVDLHGAWELFDVPARETFRQRLGVSDNEWLRGRAWALGIALGITYYWQTMPGRVRDRVNMARNVLADAAHNPA